LFEVEKLKYLEDFKNEHFQTEEVFSRIKTNLDEQTATLTEKMQANKQLIADLEIKNAELEILTTEKSELIAELTFDIDEIKRTHKRIKII
jgi:hypothetical protein